MEYYEILSDRAKPLGELAFSDINFSRSTAYAALFVAFVTYSIISRFRAWYRLRHIPGPFWCGFSSFWLYRESWDGTLYTALGQLAKKYGPSRLPSHTYMPTFPARAVLVDEDLGS
jgi:hypothetical protein